MISLARPFPTVLFPTALLVLGVVAGAGAAPAATRAELVMGTIARITLVDGRDDAAFEAGFAALRRVDEAMSLYHPDSGLVRVNARAGRRAERVDPDLYACLARAQAMSAATDGAFDATVLPLLQAWGAYPDLPYLPVGRADAVGWGNLELDRRAHTVRFARAGMGVDLGGIAKGFALDRTRAALVAAGVRRAVIDLGGNLAMVGDQIGGWRIAVRDPTDPNGTIGTLVLDGGLSVSTSGNYARDFAAEGWRTRSHIFDPRSGRAVRADLAVTVWGPEGAAADALSTALLVLGPTRAADVLARVPGAGALFVDDGGPARRIVFAGRAPRGFGPRAAAARVAVNAIERKTAE